MIKEKNKAAPDKEALVSRVYSQIEGSRYVQTFHETLQILDAGYISENKEEAHRLFREIYTLALIFEEKIDDVKRKIQEKLKSDRKGLTWLWFKKEIIAEFVIHEHIGRAREYNLKKLWDVLEESLSISDNELRRKLQRFCEGIWVTGQKEVENVYL